MKTSENQALREHVVYLLKGGGAHAKFADVVGDFPVDLQGKRVSELPYTAWMLLEHMRIAQWDILEFSRNRKHVSPDWPGDYWPKTEAPPSASAWKDGVQSFHKDLRAMQALVSNAKTNLYEPIAWGDGQTVLREALLVADHNAYHLGQLVMLRRLLGAWKE
jgi:hypothetical protein